MTWAEYVYIRCSSVVTAVVHWCLIKAFPELRWDFTRKIKVLWGCRAPDFQKYCQLAIEWKVTFPPTWLQLSYCCAHHGTLEVKAMILQTVKVHIRVWSLQG